MPRKEKVKKASSGSAGRAADARRQVDKGVGNEIL